MPSDDDFFEAGTGLRSADILVLDDFRKSTSNVLILDHFRKNAKDPEQDKDIFSAPEIKTLYGGLDSFPESVQHKLIRSGKANFSSFVKGLVHASEDVFVDPDDGEKNEPIYYALVKELDFTDRYARDFFEPADADHLEIPDPVLECLGGAYHHLTPEEWPEDISDDALSLLEQVEAIKQDPRPSETQYAKSDARYLFLLHAISEIEQAFASLLRDKWDDKKNKRFETSILSRLRMINPANSLVEHYLITMLDGIDFIRRNDDMPELEGVRLFRQAREHQHTIFDIFESVDIPDSEAIANAVNVVMHLYSQEQFMSTSEVFYRFAQSNMMPIITYYNMRPDDRNDPDIHDVVAYSLIHNFIGGQKTDVWKIVEDYMPEKKELFKDWFCILNSNQNWDALDPKISGALQDMIAAKSYTELTRLSLIMKQDMGDMVTPHENMHEIKGTLHSIKYDMLSPVEGGGKRKTELQELSWAQLVSAFEEFDSVFKNHPAYRNNSGFDPGGGGDGESEGPHLEIADQSEDPEPEDSPEFE